MSTATATVTPLTVRQRQTAAARRRASRQHPAIAGALDRRLLRLSARLAAHSITLREALDELYDVHCRRTTAAAQATAAAQRMPEAVADAYVVAEATRAYLEVEVDRQASAPAIAFSERRLGEVLVLPCGGRVGPAEQPVQAPTRPVDLW